MAETRADAERAFDHFLASFSAKYLKATECLAKDRADLLAFYDFPASTGLTCVAAIRLNPLSPLCVTAPIAPKAA